MTFSGVLLAGGESRRMGRDKATITIGGEPLWQRQIALLRTIEPAEVLVSARAQPAWLPAQTKLVLDEPPSRGPLSGLALALDRMRTTHLLALAVDLPLMTAPHLQFLCRLVTEARGVLPMIGERAEPLAAIYPREVAAEFSAALSGTDYSLQRLSRNLVQAGKLLRYEIPEQQHLLYRNVNAPSDLPTEKT